MVGDLFAADADTASDCDDEPDERDAAATTVLTFGALTVRVVEAAGAFGGSGADQSGNVVWGAAAALAEELEGRDFAGKTVVELGCGCAVVSVVAAKRGAARVVATDASPAVLRRAGRTLALNDCGAAASTAALDWERCLGDGGDDAAPEDLRAIADVVVASDVVYGEDAVPALVAAVAHVARPGADVLVAARDGRRGVDLFLAVAREAFLETRPPRAAAPAAGRARGDGHALYFFANAPPAADVAPLRRGAPGAAEAETLAKLAEKRAELAGCKADVAALQGDLRAMAETVKADMDALIAAFAAHVSGALPPGEPFVPPPRGDLPEIPPPPGDADAAGDEGAAS